VKSETLSGCMGEYPCHRTLPRRFRGGNAPVRPTGRVGMPTSMSRGRLPVCLPTSIESALAAGGLRGRDHSSMMRGLPGWDLVLSASTCSRRDPA
jgi:hypothetical protein